MLCSGGYSCAEIAEKPYFKRFSEIEKITVILSKLRWTHEESGRKAEFVFPMEEMEPPVSDTEYRRELGLLSKDELVKDSEGYIEDEGISWNEAFPESVEDAKGDTVSEQTQQEKADVIEKVEKAVIENARDVSEDSESRKKAPVVRKIHFDDDAESVSSGESTVKSDSAKEAAIEPARSSKAEQAEKELAETSSIEPEKPIEDYPYNQREAIEGYADGVDSNLLSLVEKVYSGTSDKFTRVNLGQVDEKAAQDISKLVDFSVENNNYAISTSGIQHVKNRHGKNGTHDNTMANPEDVARIPFIIHNYDNIELLTDHNGEPVLSSEYSNSDNTPAKMLRMSKKINGVYYVVEAVPESKYKKIWVVSAYISKNDVTQVLNADDSSTLSSKSSETPLVSPSFNDSIRGNDVGNVSENVNVLQNKTNTAADTGVTGQADVKNNSTDVTRAAQKAESHAADVPDESSVREDMSREANGEAKAKDETRPETKNNAESENVSETSGLSEEARKALETVRRTAQSLKEALKSKKQGGIYSGTDEQTIRATEDLSKAFGVRILLFDGDGKTDIDGFYDRKTNTIYLNAGSHSKPIQATVRHEMIHFLARANTGAFEAFRDFVAGRYAETYGKDALNTWLDNKKAEYEAAGIELDENSAKEELCADLAMDMLTDPETVKGFAKENRSAARRILGALRRFIDKIRAVFGLEPKYTAGKARALEALSKTDSTVKVTDGKVERSHASFKNDTLPKALNVKDLYAAEKLLYQALTSAEIRNSNANSDGIRFSGETDSDTDIITVKDIDNLRSIGRKSVNDFTSEDIKKAEPFARRYFKELGVKSPFFRAWFGDWRAHDTSKIKPIHVNTHKSEIERGHFVNEDTGWNIGVSSVGINDTISHSGKEKLSVIAMNNLGDIIRNSVLLDSETSQTGGKKGSNTMFMHKLYAPTYIGNRLYVSKLTVEEYRSGTDTNKRFYNLAEIKMSPALGGLSDNNTASTMRISDDINSVTQLYSFVKAYDKDFHAKDANPSLLDEDGKPLVVYHGTDADFTVFKSKDGNYWFSASEDYAEAMAEERGGNRDMPTYLNMRKPYYAKLKPSQFSDPNFEAPIIREAKSKGYDGVIIENDTDNDLAKDTFYVVFNPEQIKSATDNIGTFDGSNANIRFSVSEAADDTAKPKPDKGQIVIVENALAKEEARRLNENAPGEYARAAEERRSIERAAVEEGIQEAQERENDPNLIVENALAKEESRRLNEKASAEYDRLLQEEYNKRQVLYSPDEGKSVKREDLKLVDKKYLERTERQLMNRLAQRMD